MLKKGLNQRVHKNTLKKIIVIMIPLSGMITPTLY